MIQVQSSHIKGVEYDEGLYILRVQFKDDAVYEYRHVDPALWASLQACIKADESIGRWLHANIRKDCIMHPYTRIK